MTSTDTDPAMSEKEPTTNEEIAKMAEMKFWMFWGTIIFLIYLTALALFIKLAPPNYIQVPPRVGMIQTGGLTQPPAS